MTLEEALKRLEWKAQNLKKFSDDGRYMGLRSELSSGACYELGVEILQEITAIKEALAQQAAYFQLLALQADEAARMCGIESDEMHKFMHSFFATNVDWSQIK